MKTKLLLSICMCCLVHLATGAPDTIRLVNKGMMAVAKRTDGTPSLYVPHAVWMNGDGVAIFQDGISFIGGNFYQDATTNVFYRDAAGKFTSTGKIVFFRNNGTGDAGTKRYVKTNDPLNNIDNFDRGRYFVAFPEIEIRTKDTLVIPARMGIDALRLSSDNSYGKLWLESNTIGGKSYDASLRITGSMTAESKDLLPPGAVIIERDLAPYRIADNGTGNGTLFAFASPFKAQRSGYFAGNWIRRMIEDDDNYGHVQYVYGNERGSDGVIYSRQYIVDPAEVFE
ncbi:MAG: hypothetical protein LBC40_04465, partial [Dysgonamonadaceae bacterium]|nr:hypothetical protein [Dysgonamonadaceae bacterium]